MSECGRVSIGRSVLKHAASTEITLRLLRFDDEVRFWPLVHCPSNQCNPSLTPFAPSRCILPITSHQSASSISLLAPCPPSDGLAPPRRASCGELLAHLRPRHTNKIITTHAIAVTITVTMTTLRINGRAVEADLSTRTVVAAGQCPLMSTAVPTSIQS